jgi:hypothetical protein
MQPKGWVSAPSRFPREPAPVNPAGPAPGPGLLGTVAAVARPLAIFACRSSCAWQETEETLESERLFACAGCGSEWVPSEPWTPIDWTGAVPEPVQRARRARGGG